MNTALAAALAAGCALGACSSPRRVYTFRELKAGKHSNYPIAQGRCFKTLDDYRKFANGVRALGPNCELPADLPGVDWTREMVIAMFGGSSDTSQRVTFVRAGDLAGAMVVIWRREGDAADAVFPDEVVDLTPNPEPATPFLVGALPRAPGAVNFIQSQRPTDVP